MSVHELLESGFGTMASAMIQGFQSLASSQVLERGFSNVGNSLYLAINHTLIHKFFSDIDDENVVNNMSILLLKMTEMTEQVTVLIVPVVHGLIVGVAVTCACLCILCCTMIFICLEIRKLNQKSIRTHRYIEHKVSEDL